MGATVYSRQDLDGMIRIGTIMRLLISVGMIIALIVPYAPSAFGHSSCQMVCSKGKRACHSCCMGDFSCGMSKSKSDAPRPLVALQRTVTSGSSCQAVLTRTILLVLPTTAKLPPEWRARPLKHPGDSLTGNCILLI